MKRLLIFATILSLSLYTMAQKKVAVWETKCSDKSITSFQSTMVRGGMETAVGNTPGYEVYDRSAFDAIMKEHNFQRSGSVSDSDIKRLGVMAGVQYIIVPEATVEGNEFYILVKMLDVETGKFGAVYEGLCGPTGMEIKKACAELGTRLFGTTESSGNNQTGGSNAIKGKMLSIDELKSSGFRFLKHRNRIKVISQSDFQGTYISNVSPYAIRDKKFIDNMPYYGGEVTKDGSLNGVVIIKGNDNSRYLAYICEGRLAFPILEVGFYDGGLYMSLKENTYSYGCIYPSWDGYRNSELCGSMREVYRKDFSNQSVLREIYNATIDLTSLEDAFKLFVRSGKKLDDSWSDDPKYMNEYEDIKPIVEGYQPGDPNIYKPSENGVLLYSYASEFYCDGVYDSDEAKHRNGHGFHTPNKALNLNHFRVVFSFKAVSNTEEDEQWPLMFSDCRLLGVCLYEDGTINITTDGMDHYYVTGHTYSPNKYTEIDMEYNYGVLTINGHRFNVSMDVSDFDEWSCDYGFHSLNYSNGAAFKGYIKDVKIYTYPN